MGWRRRSTFMGDYFHSPDKVIGLFPDWYAPIQPDWPANTTLTGFVEYDTETGESLVPEVQAFLDAGPATHRLYRRQLQPAWP